MKTLRIGIRSNTPGRPIPIDDHEVAINADDLLAIIHNGMQALPREMRDNAMAVVSIEGGEQVTPRPKSFNDEFDELRSSAIKGALSEPG